MRVLSCSIFVAHFLYNVCVFADGMSVPRCILWEEEQKMAVRSPQAGPALATLSLGAKSQRSHHRRCCSGPTTCRG